MKLYKVYETVTVDYDYDELAEIIVGIFKDESKAREYSEFIRVKDGKYFSVAPIETMDDWKPTEKVIYNYSTTYYITHNSTSRINQIDGSRIELHTRSEATDFKVNTEPFIDIHTKDNQVEVSINIDYTEEMPGLDVENIMLDKTQPIIKKIIEKLDAGIFSYEEFKKCIK